jgi:hypothetical protein
MVSERGVSHGKSTARCRALLFLASTATMACVLPDGTRLFDGDAAFRRARNRVGAALADPHGARDVVPTSVLRHLHYRMHHELSHCDCLHDAGLAACCCPECVQCAAMLGAYTPSARHMRAALGPLRASHGADAPPAPGQQLPPLVSTPNAMWRRIREVERAGGFTRTHLLRYDAMAVGLAMARFLCTAGARAMDRPAAAAGGGPAWSFDACFALLWDLVFNHASLLATTGGGGDARLRLLCAAARALCVAFARLDAPAAKGAQALAAGRFDWTASVNYYRHASVLFHVQLSAVRLSTPAGVGSGGVRGRNVAWSPTSGAAPASVHLVGARLLDGGVHALAAHLGRTGYLAEQRKYARFPGDARTWCVLIVAHASLVNVVATLKHVARANARLVASSAYRDNVPREQRGLPYQVCRYTARACAIVAPPLLVATLQHAYVPYFALVEQVPGGGRVATWPLLARAFFMHHVRCARCFPPARHVAPTNAFLCAMAIRCAFDALRRFVFKLAKPTCELATSSAWFLRFYRTLPRLLATVYPDHALFERALGAGGGVWHGLVGFMDAGPAAPPQRVNVGAARRALRGIERHRAGGAPNADGAARMSRVTPVALVPSRCLLQYTVARANERGIGNDGHIAVHWWRVDELPPPMHAGDDAGSANVPPFVGTFAPVDIDAAAPSPPPTANDDDDGHGRRRRDMERVYGYGRTPRMMRGWPAPAGHDIAAHAVLRLVLLHEGVDTACAQRLFESGLHHPSGAAWVTERRARRCARYRPVDARDGAGCACSASMPAPFFAYMASVFQRACMPPDDWPVSRLDAGVARACVSTSTRMVTVSGAIVSLTEAFPCVSAAASVAGATMTPAIHPVLLDRLVLPCTDFAVAAAPGRRPMAAASVSTEAAVPVAVAASTEAVVPSSAANGGDGTHDAATVVGEDTRHWLSVIWPHLDDDAALDSVDPELIGALSADSAAMRSDTWHARMAVESTDTALDAAAAAATPADTAAVATPADTAASATPADTPNAATVDGGGQGGGVSLLAGRRRARPAPNGGGSTLSAAHDTRVHHKYMRLVTSPAASHARQVNLRYHHAST